MNLTLRPYQKRGVNFLTNKRRYKLLADDPGLGKTIQVIAAANKLKPKSVLIICPAAVKLHWQNKIKEFGTWTNQVTTLFGYDATVPKAANTVIANYELVVEGKVRDQLKRPWDITVIDESHYLGSIDSQRTNAVLGNEGVSRYAKRIFCLSGTPVENRVFQFYPILHTMADELLAPHNDAISYAKRYCDGSLDDSGRLIAEGSSNVGELNEKIQPFMLRRTIDEVAKDLPPVSVNVVYLPVEINWVEYDQDEDYNLDSVATVRRITAINKIKEIVSIINEKLDSIKKIVIFYHHQDVQKQLQQKLFYHGILSIKGGMSSEAKQSTIKEFKDSDKKVLLCSIFAAGTGTDGIQEAANHMVFAEIDWTPGKLEQSIGRLRRIGQTKPVFVDLLLIPETIEDGMWSVVQEKQKVINRLVHQDKEQIMSIENTLEKLLEVNTRIANSLELLEGKALTAPVQEEPKKAAPKKATPKKAATKKEELEPKKEELEPKKEELKPKKEEPKTPSVTLEDVVAACTKFVSTFEDTKDGQDAARKILRDSFNVAKVSSLDPEDYQSALDQFTKGVEAMTVSADDDGDLI